MHHFGSDPNNNVPNTADEKWRAIVDDYPYAEDITKFFVNESGALIIATEDGAHYVLASGQWKTAFTELMTDENTIPVG